MRGMTSILTWHLRHIAAGWTDRELESHPDLPATRTGPATHTTCKERRRILLRDLGATTAAQACHQELTTTNPAITAATISADAPPGTPTTDIQIALATTAATTWTTPVANTTTGFDIVAALAAGHRAQQIATTAGVSPSIVWDWIAAARATTHTRTTAHLITITTLAGITR